MVLKNVKYEYNRYRRFKSYQENILSCVFIAELIILQQFYLFKCFFVDNDYTRLFVNLFI